MAKRGKNPFRGFTLLELSHLDNAEILFKPEVARKILLDRFNFGKKIIGKETKHGDLVMLESPHKESYKDYEELFGKLADKKKWDSIIKFHANFYYALAEYAEAKGRKVASLDTSVIWWKGRLSKIIALPQKTTKVKAGVDYLRVVKRDKFMQARIQQKKPKLVIVAEGHAIALENAMKPKKVIYDKPFANNPEFKKKVLKQKERLTSYYLELKKRHREQALKEKGLKMKRGWKPKP